METLAAEFATLGTDFWQASAAQAIVWQLAALLTSLLLGAYASRRTGRRKAKSAESFSAASVARLSFSLTALAAVLLAILVLRSWIDVRLLAMAVPFLLSLAITCIVFYILRQALGHSRWISFAEGGFTLLVLSAVALSLLGVLPHVVAAMESVRFSLGKQELNLWLLLEGLAVIFGALLLALWLAGLIENRLNQAAGLDANLRVVFARLAKASLLLVAALIGLPLVGIDLTTLSIFSGAFGVGLGFGLQKIASNYVSGFIILLDRSIRIGNVISVGPERGQVARITTRYTVLIGGNGVEAIVPNETLVASVVRNESMTDPHARMAISVEIAYGSDVERAIGILGELAAGEPHVLAEPPPRAMVTAFGASGIKLELGFWVADPPEGSQQIASAIHLAILRAFAAAGIEIAFARRA